MRSEGDEKKGPSAEKTMEEGERVGKNGEEGGGVKGVWEE